MTTRWNHSEPFTRGPGGARYPSLWNGLEFAWMPHLTKGGATVLDFGPYKRHGHFVGGLAVSHWVDGEIYGACLDLSNSDTTDEAAMHCWQWGSASSVWDTEQSGHFVKNFHRMTVVAAQKPNDVSATHNVVYGRSYNIPSGAKDCPISLNVNDNDVETNRHGMFKRDNDNYQGSGSNDTGSADGAWRIVGGRWGNDDKPETWTNGVLREKRSAATTAVSNSDNNSVHAAGAFRGATGSKMCDGLLGPVCVWSRPLEDTELLTCLNDPFAVIRLAGYYNNE